MFSWAVGGISKGVRISHGKRVIGVWVIEVIEVLLKFRKKGQVWAPYKPGLSPSDHSKAIFMLQ